MKKIYIILCIVFSVPLALMAQKGELKEGSIINGANGKPAGIVFQYDAATQTGYMVSLVETELPWGGTGTNIDHTVDYINSAVAGEDFSGLVNTAAIFSQLGTKENYAAKWCFELNAGGMTGWYLPSLGELNLLRSKLQVVNQALEKIKGATRLASAWHWSSSEGNFDLSWNVNFSGGDNYPAEKSVSKHVRAIRKF